MVKIMKMEIKNKRKETILSLVSNSFNIEQAGKRGFLLNGGPHFK